MEKKYVIEYSWGNGVFNERFEIKAKTEQEAILIGADMYERHTINIKGVKWLKNLFISTGLPEGYFPGYYILTKPQ